MKKDLYNAYNLDEVLSALHKMLRKGDIPLSCYFAKLLIIMEGVWKVKQYLFLICFEETYNIDLYRKIETVFSKHDTDVDDIEIYELCYLFCKSKKRWEDPLGSATLKKQIYVRDLFTQDFENNYKRHSLSNVFLQGQYGNILKDYEVCYSSKTGKFKKVGIYTPDELFGIIKESIEEKDVDKLIYMGMYFSDHKDKLPFEVLKEFISFDFSKEMFSIMNKRNGKYSYWFNYVVLFYSMLFEMDILNLEECSNHSYLKKIETRINKALNEKRYFQIPLCALDSHTSRGKIIMSEKDNKLILNSVIVGMDYRYSGYKESILWRIAAIKQFNSIDVNWEDVFVDYKLDVI